MGLLTPWFLAGLAALGIPLLLHLTRRRAKQAVEFPSLMFLSQVPYRSLRRRRVEQLALLAMRCGALALLALAFARPLIPGSVLGASEVPRTELTVAVDRSLSMGTADRWPEAVAAAKQAIEGSLENDIVHLVAFDQDAELVTSAEGTSGETGRAAALAALEGLTVSSRETDYRQVLEVSRRLVLDSELPKQRVVIITDLQRQGFAEASDLEPLPRGVTANVIDVGQSLAEEWVNLVVIESEFDREVVEKRERIRSFARVRNTGTAAATGTISLNLDGRELESLPLEVKAQGSERVDFEPFLLEEGRPSTIEIGLSSSDDVLAGDNRHLAVLSASQGLGVLIVEAANRSRSRSLFVERALTFSRNPLFRVQKVRAGALSTEALARSSVVVLQDSAEDVSPEMWTAIERFVARGGGLLIAAGRQTTVLPETGLALPAFTAAERRERKRRRLALFDYGHSALAPFQQPRSGDFSGATFFLRHRAEPGGDDRVLARFDDGSPALIEVVQSASSTGPVTEGGGRVMLWLTTLDTSWNDLALQPVFLPFVHRLTGYLAGFSPPPASFDVGQIARLQLDEPGQWLVIAPDGSQIQNDFEREILIPMEQSGLYTVRPVASGTTERLVAANTPRSESDLTRIDVEEFSAAVQPSQDPATGTVAVEGEEPAAESGTQLWWPLLVAAALLLVLESVISKGRSATLGSVGQRAPAEANT